MKTVVWWCLAVNKRATKKKVIHIAVPKSALHKTRYALQLQLHQCVIGIFWDSVQKPWYLSRFLELILKGPYRQKINKLKKIAYNEVSTCSGCCCVISQVCDVCKEVLGGLNGTTTHQNLRNFCRKIVPLKSFKFATSKQPNSHSFWATWLILV